MPRSPRVTLTPEQVQLGQGNVLSLTGEQAHYLLRVLRLRVGDRFFGIPHHGGVWWQLMLAEAQRAIILGTVANQRELPVDLELAITLPKHLDELISAVTELGVTQITPLYSDRSMLKPDHPLGSHKLQRWQKIAQEAVELSCRSRIPHILPPMPYSQFIQQCNSQERWLCVTTPAEHLWAVCQARSPLRGTITVVTGCEGGWTPAEQEAAIGKGFVPVSLGQRILSAKTAPVVALAIITSAIESAL